MGPFCKVLLSLGRGIERIVEGKDFKTVQGFPSYYAQFIASVGFNNRSLVFVRGTTVKPQNS